ncbi:uncharacterized protein A4U43_C01F3960 [Asparagus officinalis]|uniref:Uncharacterized protein n=1 Tax=Asparagus officinalis TaxID=4686 RepID=A0A5P1FM49_ASPOF|nr:uncharacterized protein A4U43_C01F3960 [Asparagus officinalis]
MFCGAYRSIPFFVGDPLRISGKRSRRDSQALVGPVLPVPFLLLLQRMDHQKTSSCVNEEPNDDLLISECQSTLESIHPEISLADTGNFSDFGSSNGLQNEKSFFVYEKSVICNAPSSKGSWKTAGCGVKEEPQEIKDTSLETETACEDEKFTTFVCGISDKAYHSYSGNEAEGLEMFDQLNPYRLDFDSPSVVFQPKEKEMYKRLTKQSFKWLVDYKPHEEFCIASDTPKPPH